MIKRIGAHRIRLLDGNMLFNEIVVICNGTIIDHYPLVEEEANVEWYHGQIDIASFLK